MPAMEQNKKKPGQHEFAIKHWRNPYIPKDIKAINILARALNNEQDLKLLTLWQRKFTISCLTRLRNGKPLSRKQSKAAIKNAEKVLPLLKLHKLKPYDIPYHHNRPMPTTNLY